jgi:hypothetical protein
MVVQLLHMQLKNNKEQGNAKISNCPHATPFTKQCLGQPL